MSVVTLCPFPGGATAINPTVPDYYRTALLLDATGQADGTGYTAESSRHGRSLTWNGGASISGGKFTFDGTGYIEIPRSITLTPGHKFTMQMNALRFNAVATGTPQVVIGVYDFIPGPGSDYNEWRIQANGSGGLEFAWSTSGDVTTHTFAIGSISAATNYDLAVNWDGETVWALLNGSQVASMPFNGRFATTFGQFLVGGGLESNTLNFTLNGSFKSFSFTKGEVLYDKTSAYNAPALPRTMNTPTLTDAQWPNVIFLLDYDSTLGRIVDRGPLDLPISLGGNVVGSTTITLPDGTKSIALDGSGDGLFFLDDPIFELGSGEWTFETFARHTVNNALHVLFSHWDGGGSNRSYSFQYRGADATDNLRLFYSTSGTNSNGNTQGNWTPTVDTWYHEAFCRSGNDFRVFVDGAQKGSTHTAADTLYDSSDHVYVGSYDGLANSVNGYMAQTRLTKAARYPSGFTAPTGALPVG